MLTAGRPGFLFIGHRGYAGKYPENTLAGFQAAAAAGLKMVELDVRLSSDRCVMVIHDADLTRVAGIPRRVGEMRCAELLALDAGTWFDPAFSGEGVPTLAQVFERLPPAVGINVEIKPDEHEPADPSDGIERQVLAEIDRRGAQRPVLISSFNPAVLRRLRAISTDQPLAVLSDAQRQPHGIPLCRVIGAAAWHPHHRLVTRRRVTAAHRLGLKVFAFTVNTASDYRRVKRAGVDGIFSDDPPALMD
jgi:glycerophosphoryl diester phosphodiesterase